MQIKKWSEEQKQIFFNNRHLSTYFLGFSQGNLDTKIVFIVFSEITLMTKQSKGENKNKNTHTHMKQ